MNQAHEVRNRLNVQDEPDGDQQAETAEEYQARWEDNLAFVEREVTAFANRYGLERFPITDLSRVNVIVAYLQANRTKDRNLWRTGFQAPRKRDKEDNRAWYRDRAGFRRPVSERGRLARERYAANNGEETENKQKTKIQTMMNNRQLEPNAADAEVEESGEEKPQNGEPQARVMTGNLQLEHDNEREEVREEEEDDWVMV